jgi:hypothetical protein
VCEEAPARAILVRLGQARNRTFQLLFCLLVVHLGVSKPG